MVRIARAIVCLAGALAGPAWADAYDALPGGPPGHVAQFYHSALALPDVGGWDADRRLRLLDAATLRYRDRLVDRASWPSTDAALRHVERLAASEAMHHHQLEQACAQYGLLEGPCADHAGYVRRVCVVEEMLVQGRLTLAGLERELAGASRPGLGDAR